jgi:hypothetical protein
VNASLSTRQIWGAPLTLGVVSAVGLVAALLAYGLWDVLSWIALAVPVAVSAWGLWRPRFSALPKRLSDKTHPVRHAQLGEGARKRVTSSQEKKVPEK